MKKLFILLCLSGLISAVPAQQNIFKKIAGENGLSNQFTLLPGAEQVPFNPAKARAIFGLDAKANLILIRKEPDEYSLLHYRYYQTYHNIPVENAMFIAHTKNGKLISTSGVIITRFGEKNKPVIKTLLSSSSAIKAALNFVRAEKYAWQEENFEYRIKLRKGIAASYYPVPLKVWYSGEGKINPATLKLAYKIDVYTLKPFDRKFIYVDAETGKILGAKQELMHADAVGNAATGYSGNQAIHSEQNGSAYRLRDITKGKGIKTLHASGKHADYTSPTANWTLTGQDKWALDAHFGVAATWTFYKKVFNRSSIDNAGFALTSWVNDTSMINNAAWDGSEMEFGNLSNGNGITSIDITAHELTHGVTQFTSDLDYSKEPGAINESMSDIMGKSVQFYTKPLDSNWVLSNDMAWEIRSFSAPNMHNQPDTYKGVYWVSTDSATKSNDYGGVHINSGVGNYMFYLLVAGGAGTNDIGNSYSVSGIGLAKADQIIYRTETVYLTSTAIYADWRLACINAATDLYGAASNEVIQVKNAWFAVGVGTAGGSNCNLPVPNNLSVGFISDTTATLSWDTVPGTTAYTLQWKPSAASTFTNVTGITGTSYKLSGLARASWYQVKISAVCSTGANGAFTAPLDSFKTTGSIAVNYCSSAGDILDGITNVTFNTINNNSSSTSAGYTDYTLTKSTTVNQGSTYTISVKVNTGGNYTDYAKAWIDWNHDGVFNAIDEEYNLGTAKNVTNGSTTLSPLAVTVPAAAVIGSTRMRVSLQYNQAPAACTASFDGEVEDYTVVIAAGSSSACPVSSGLSVTAVTNTSATLRWAAVSGATGYRVQYRRNGTTTWNTASASGNSLGISGLTAGTNYQFQVATLCSGGAVSVYTNPFMFTTTGGVITYCASKGTTTYEYIKTVVLGSINHTVSNDGGYGNYTNLSTGLTAGNSYTIKITPGFTESSFTENYTVYIDYNKDGFLNGSGEIVVKGSGTGSGAKSLVFTVPTTAKNGATRLRIQMSFVSSVDPCAVLSYGDVHDYTVNISVGTGLNAAASIASQAETGVKGIKIFPNPISNTGATVSYHLAKDGLVSLRVLDMPGRIIQSITIGQRNKGAYIYLLKNTKALKKGNYFIAIYQNKELIGRTKLAVLNN